jgi:hypothetical protein
MTVVVSFLEGVIHIVQIFGNEERVVASLCKKQQRLYVLGK